MSALPPAPPEMAGMDPSILALMGYSAPIDTVADAANVAVTEDVVTQTQPVLDRSDDDGKCDGEIVHVSIESGRLLVSVKRAKAAKYAPAEEVPIEKIVSWLGIFSAGNVRRRAVATVLQKNKLAKFEGEMDGKVDEWFQRIWDFNDPAWKNKRFRCHEIEFAQDTVIDEAPDYQTKDAAAPVESTLNTSKVTVGPIQWRASKSILETHTDFNARLEILGDVFDAVIADMRAQNAKKRSVPSGQPPSLAEDCMRLHATVDVIWAGMRVSPANGEPWHHSGAFLTSFMDICANQFPEKTGSMMATMIKKEASTQATGS